MPHFYMNHHLGLGRKRKWKCLCLNPSKVSSALISMSYFCITLLKSLFFPLALQWSNDPEYMTKVPQLSESWIFSSDSYQKQLMFLKHASEAYCLQKSEEKQTNKQMNHIIAILFLGFVTYYGYIRLEMFFWLSVISLICFCVKNVIYTSLEPKGKFLFSSKKWMVEIWILDKNFKIRQSTPA